MEGSVLPLLTDPCIVRHLMKCMKWKSTKQLTAWLWGSQMIICTDYQILYLSWWGWQQLSQSNYFQHAFPPQYRMQLWYSFCHTPEGRRKHQSDDTSGDCKWNTGSHYWKPRIVESLHPHTSKPRAIPWPSLFQKNWPNSFQWFHQQQYHKHSAQALNPTHRLKTFSTSTKEMQKKTNRLKEKKS